MKCLNCGDEMAANLVMTRDAEIAYDVCEACGSLWLDAGELDKMAFQVEGSIEFSSQEPAPAVPAPRKPCPRCDEARLEKVSFVGYSDIVLDRCPSCGGFWLDGGELDLVNRELEDIMPVHGKGFSEFVNELHVPYWHKRLRVRGGASDFTREAPPIKGAELEGGTDYTCPACDAKLNRYRAFGVCIEGCPECKGIWLEKDELRKLKDRALREPWTDLRWVDDEVDALQRAAAMPSRRTCPRCAKQRLVSAALGGSRIIVDRCPSCEGTWLDRDEFRELTRHLRERYESMTPQELRHQVREELKGTWAGPEGALAEALDAKAAVAALINVTIFEHPRLAKLLSALSRAASSIGL